MNQIRFGDVLRARMKSRRMRVGELALATGILQPQISQYLNHTCRPAEQTIEKIAEKLEWPLQDALHCAGYHRPDLDAPGEEMGPELAELSDIIEPLAPEHRRLVLSQLREWARGLVGILAETGQRASQAENQIHNRVLCIRFDRTGALFPVSRTDCCFPSRIPIRVLAA